MLDIELGKDLPIPVIDLVTILANAYENAIYGCMESEKAGKREGMPDSSYDKKEKE